MPFLQILLAASGDNAWDIKKHRETSPTKTSLHLPANDASVYLFLPPFWAMKEAVSEYSPIPAGYGDSARSWEAWEQRGHLPIAGLRSHRGMQGVFGRNMGGTWGTKAKLVSTRCWLCFLRKSIFALLPLMLVLEVKALGWRWRHRSGNVLLQTDWPQREFLLLAWY